MLKALSQFDMQIQQTQSTIFLLQFSLKNSKSIITIFYRLHRVWEEHTDKRDWLSSDLLISLFERSSVQKSKIKESKFMTFNSNQIRK